MSLNLVSDRFEVLRDNTKCIRCKVCVKQCSNEVHIFDEEDNIVLSNDSKCVCCHRCVAMCPTKAIKIRKKMMDI